MACTTILVGKNASYDGSTLVARNEDSGFTSFRAKKLIVVKPEEQIKNYKSLTSKVEINLPNNPMRYTCMPNAFREIQGIWGALGVNEVNVAMTATETITSNPRVLGADPLVKYIPQTGIKGEEGYEPEQFGGIGEEDLVTIILPYIKSAKEGVERLGYLLENFGTYEINGIAFQDENDIWWVETIGGHHYIARRVPDDCYVIMPNQFGIDEFDFEDAFGEQKNYMCSKDLKEFIETHHLDLSMNNKFNPRDAFGSHSDADHVYNTPRTWISQRYLNPNSNKWDGIDADYGPESDNMPWCRVPEKKITVEDVKYVLSLYYQGTSYNPYGDGEEKGKYRPIGINRNNVIGLTQIRPYMPDSIKSLEWFSFGSNTFNTMAPIYVNIKRAPKYFENTPRTVSTESFYWANRLIGALADSHFKNCASHIENYQLKTQSEATSIINKYDKEMMNLSYNDATAICEKANDEIEHLLRTKTNEVLDKVLFEASLEMKNVYKMCQ